MINENAPCPGRSRGYKLAACRLLCRKQVAGLCAASRTTTSRTCPICPLWLARIEPRLTSVEDTDNGIFAQALRYEFTGGGYSNYQLQAGTPWIRFVVTPKQLEFHGRGLNLFRIGPWIVPRSERDTPERGNTLFRFRAESHKIRDDDVVGSPRIRNSRCVGSMVSTTPQPMILVITAGLTKRPLKTYVTSVSCRSRRSGPVSVRGSMTTLPRRGKPRRSSDRVVLPDRLAGLFRCSHYALRPLGQKDPRHVLPGEEVDPDSQKDGVGAALIKGADRGTFEPPNPSAVILGWTFRSNVEKKHLPAAEVSLGDSPEPTGQMPLYGRGHSKACEYRSAACNAV